MKKVTKINEKLIKVTLKNKNISVELLNLGASIFSFKYNDNNILVGPSNIKDFIKPDHHYGKTVGRFCGRLPVKGLTINKENIVLEPFKSEDGTIHGGENGFSRRYFDFVETTQNEAVFTLFDRSSNSNLPGDVNFKVIYRLEEDTLKVLYKATTTKDTLLNITNHSYFNLDKTETILNHSLQVEAKKYVKFSPTYEILGIDNVSNTVFDLTTPTLLKKPLSKLKNGPFKGFDTIYLFDKNKKVQLYSELSQVNLTITTDYPAVVIFTHNNRSPDNVSYFNTQAFHGIAIECMYEPGGILTPYLNNAILTKDKTYEHFIAYTLSKK